MKQLALALVLLFNSLAIMAEVLEYSLAPNPHPTVEAQWLDNGHGKDDERGSKMVARLVNVELRFKIPVKYYSPPSDIKIFIHLPSQLVGLRDSRGLEVSWQTHGRFQSGRIRPGARVLLYEGSVADAALIDIIDFTFIIDARGMMGDFQFEPVYEIESK